MFDHALSSQGLAGLTMLCLVKVLHHGESAGYISNACLAL